MRALELKVPAVSVPVTTSELAAPEAPTEPGTVKVACAEAPAAMVPMAWVAGVAVVLPTLTEVTVTPDAGEPPVLAMVSWTITLPLTRVSVLVMTRLAGEAAALTVMVVVAEAVV